jgi:hypothetical protein
LPSSARLLHSAGDGPEYGRTTLETERASLSLCQRERTKVRDCFAVARRVRTRLLATRYQALDEPGDSRIAKRGLHGGQGILIAFDRAFGLHGSYARRRPTRWQALRLDNRNPTRNPRTDVGGEICSPRNFGSLSVAKEYAQAQSPSFAAIERDPRRLIVTVNVSSEKGFVDAPHLNPLPASGERRRSARQGHLRTLSARSIELGKERAS